MAAKKVKSPESRPSATKAELLTAAMDRINRTKGMTEFSKLRFGSEVPPVSRIRTGILTLDSIMGGGLPRARFTQFKGPESCFKTSALMHTIREVQADGGTAVYVQAEEFDRVWAERLGVDLDSLIVVPVANNGSESLEQVTELIESNGVDLAIIDSVQGIATERELETDIGAAGYGSGAPQTWGQWTRRITRAFNRGAETAVVWTSQFRSQVGKYSPTGDNSDGTQIFALKHAKAIDVLFKKGEAFKVDSQKEHGPYARDFSVRADKNKTAHPNQSGTFRFYYRDHEGVPFGIDYAREAAVLGQSVASIITRRGAWYFVAGQKVAQGIDALTAKLRDDSDIMSEVTTAIYRALDSGTGGVSSDDSDTPQLEDDESEDDDDGDDD